VRATRWLDAAKVAPVMKLFALYEKAGDVRQFKLMPRSALIVVEVADEERLRKADEVARSASLLIEEQCREEK